jgi:MFS transporter, DHA1 family, multidrug resistance protein
VVLLVSLSFSFVALVLPLWGLELGAAAWQIGAMLSAFSLVTVLGRPMVGWAIDRYGRRPFFLLGIAAYAATVVAYFFARAVVGMILARALQGAASALLWLSLRATLADLAPSNRRATMFGRMESSSAQGMVAGMVVGLVLIMSLPFELAWRWAMIVYALGALAAFLLALWGLPETRPIGAAQNTPLRRVILPGRMPEQIPPSFILLLVVVGITAVSEALIAPLVVIYVRDRLGATPFTIAWMFIPLGLVWAVLPARLGPLSDRFGRVPLMTAGLVLGAIASVVMPLISSLTAIALLWAAAAAAHAAGNPAENALVSDLCGDNRRGWGYGLHTTASGLGFTVGPLIGGWLYDHTTPAAPFFLNAAVLLVSAGLVFGLGGRLWATCGRDSARLEQSSASPPGEPVEIAQQQHAADAEGHKRQEIEAERRKHERPRPAGRLDSARGQPGGDGDGLAADEQTG